MCQVARDAARGSWGDKLDRVTQGGGAMRWGGVVCKNTY